MKTVITAAMPAITTSMKMEIVSQIVIHVARMMNIRNQTSPPNIVPNVGPQIVKSMFCSSKEGSKHAQVTRDFHNRSHAMESSPESRKEVNKMTNESKNTWYYNRNTDTHCVDLLSEADTPVSRSTGCLLHDCPGCSNIWALSPYGRTTDAVSRKSPLYCDETGKEIGFIITAARLADACWCGVPFPGEFPR